ncbi:MULTISPECIES: hypothetical protein [Virgibacillus]|uniref:Uncharacterized protein n=1 Tax=Virgibacillus chiguensis TaxID=411959 RepID=A0A1M5LZU3_9BACI|nr:MULTISPECIES: hypothetical protein [Virgibacillus]SHG70541.1 hypothetical protein SAMN05421807_101326 [Virgibacillus chiguensis]
MARAMIVLLLLAVCFLAGVVHGNNGVGHEEADSVFQAQDVIGSDELDNEKNIKSVAERNPEQQVQPDVPAPSTEKTASVLEASITGFFEAVVTILYQIAELFF